MNLATLVAGLAIATALWSGVQALNSQARTSYGQAAAVIGEAAHASFVPARGTLLAETHYVTLRRAGWRVSPVLEGAVRLKGTTYRVIGIEPLTAPRGAVVTGIDGAADLEGFLRAPGLTLVAPETLWELGVAAGAQPRAETGRALPPFRASAAVAPGLLVMDIGAAQTLLARQGHVSRLLIEGPETPDISTLPVAVRDVLRLEPAQEGGDLARMTDSFHLNLTAFGFLAFVVGLFIVHAAIGLAFEQRLAMVRTMRAVGVPLVTVMAAMVGEVVMLALGAGALGMVCGYLVAASLLPDVAASLEGLYGAHVAGTLSLDGRWWIAGLAMALAGALAAAAGSLFKIARVPVLALSKPLAWRAAQQVQLFRQGVAGFGFLAMAGAAYAWGHGLTAGFLVIAGLMLGAALLLPGLLAVALRFGEGQARGAVARWFWADTRQQLSGLSLALMALLLALAANVGVGTMVEGFRKTFTAWLDERLNSEVYFDAAGKAEAADIARWLEGRSEVRAILPTWRAETRIGAWPVDVLGTRDHATYRAHFSLLSEGAGAWDAVRDGQGVLVSEQLARRLGLAPGDRIAIPTATDAWPAEVVGIYADYGNPKGQIRLDVAALVAHWPEARRTSYSLRVEPDKAAALIAEMQAAFGEKLSRVVDQSTLKASSQRIFERTFAVTDALNTLTLLVSGVALFASLLALSDLRRAQVAPVWALGVPRRTLADLEIAKLLVLAAITAVLAVPLGLALAWCLVAIVNVQAFGWRLPFHVFPAAWGVVLVMALLTAFLAAIIPVMRLARTAPQDLLKVFANER